MLQSVTVQGFRSLLDFRIAVRQGLNVIVGPNGSGKTNFIAFLDFLSELINEGVNSAVASAHGAASTFSRESLASDLPTLKFSISGRVQRGVKGAQRRQEGFTPDYLTYEYDCSLVYDKRIPAIYIASENLYLIFDTFPDLTVRRTTIVEKESESTDIVFSPSSHPATADIAAFIGRSSSRNKLESLEPDIISQLCTQTPGRRSLISTLYDVFYFADHIHRNLVAFRSINVDPNAARLPSPVTFDEDIRSNGEGLSGVLYRLKQAEADQSYMLFSPRRINYDIPDENAFGSIVSWCREINPLLTDIDVSFEFSEGLLQPYAVFDTQSAGQRFPFSRVSDGTVKWIALTTMLFVSPRYSMIEEPENFLHPHMQTTFIQLCREILSQPDGRDQLLLSTHSLTVLDQCTPEELLLFSDEGWGTEGSRVSNVETLDEKLMQSRFGLGHYYRSGAILGADSHDR